VTSVFRVNLVGFEWKTLFFVSCLVPFGFLLKIYF
jgi:hypothetical protein